MCVDFNYLSATYHKDPYPLSGVDCLIDRSLGYRTLNFMDTNSGYNQIQMYPSDVPKTTFLSYHDNYYYNAMPFDLKNVSATYQRLMDVVFAHHKGGNPNFYVDGMIVKTIEGCKHLEDLDNVMQSIRKYNMRLNPNKFSFEV